MIVTHSLSNSISLYEIAKKPIQYSTSYTLTASTRCALL